MSFDHFSFCLPHAGPMEGGGEVRFHFDAPREMRPPAALQLGVSS